MAGGAAAASGRAALSQMPRENAAKLRGRPDQQHGRDQEQADGAAPPGQQSHQQQRQHDRQNRVGQRAWSGRAKCPSPVIK